MVTEEEYADRELLKIEKEERGREGEKRIIAASLRLKKRLGNIERKQVREEEKRNLKKLRKQIERERCTQRETEQDGIEIEEMSR